MNAFATKYLRGLLSGAMAVLLFHQTMIFLLAMTDFVPNAVAWNMAPGPHPAVPALVNAMFWGGLWGMVLAMLWEDLPGDMLVVRGALGGLIGPAMIGSWVVLPLLKHTPLFAGGDMKRIIISAVIHMAYGIGFAIIYTVLTRSREEMARKTGRHIVV
ncbi:MAG: hypothetical protein ACRCTD_13750 [Beijerinckiaceae bacterium]